jgi:lipopolysaccharide export system permease protein
VTTTFDRYLLGRFLHVFVVLFIATFGLYVIIDGFTNVDEFQESGGGVLAALARMLGYYSYQSVIFFDLIASTINVLAAMIVFALLLRHKEIHPILAAGIPTYRLVVPIVVGTLCVNAALMVNQEVIIPRNAAQLQAPRNPKRTISRDVQQVRDFSTNILITGDQLFPRDRKMLGAEFVLPVGEISHELQTLKAPEAFYRHRKGNQPAGWLLRNVSPRFDDISLTDDGRKTVLRPADPADVFIATELSFDQLYKRNTSYRYLSTPELMRRIKNPAIGLISVRGQSQHLHQRLTQPLMNLIMVLLAIPLMVRRESAGLVANFAVCTLVMAVMFGIGQVFLYLGRVNLIAPDLAAWGPVIIGGAWSAWASGWAQT